jgi:hypothetical protein
MRTVTLAALVLFGVSFATTSTSAAPFHLGAIPDEMSSLIQVAKKKPEKQHNKKRNYTGGKGFIPGHVLTPYGYADCIGWWEQHPDGRMQCHGQLIRERFWD